jgi:hypothetical protein
VRIAGAKERTRAFNRLTDAKAWAASVETDLGRGVFVPTTADRRRTVAELLDEYERIALPLRKGDAKKMRTYLAWWRGTIGFLTLGDGLRLLA